jgi:hypothetical protein
MAEIWPENSGQNGRIPADWPGSSQNGRISAYWSDSGGSGKFRSPAVLCRNPANPDFDETVRISGFILDFGYSSRNGGIR